MRKIEPTEDDAKWLALHMGAITVSMPSEPELTELVSRFEVIRAEELARLAEDARCTNALIMIELDLAGERTSQELDDAKAELDDTFRAERRGENVDAARAKVLMSLRVAIAQLPQ